MAFGSASSSIAEAPPARATPTACSHSRRPWHAAGTRDRSPSGPWSGGRGWRAARPRPASPDGWPAAARRASDQARQPRFHLTASRPHRSGLRRCRLQYRSGRTRSSQQGIHFFRPNVAVVASMPPAPAPWWPRSGPMRRRGFIAMVAGRAGGAWPGWRSTPPAGRSNRPSLASARLGLPCDGHVFHGTAVAERSGCGVSRLGCSRSRRRAITLRQPKPNATVSRW
jgi:hypothetical protein